MGIRYGRRNAACIWERSAERWTSTAERQLAAKPREAQADWDSGHHPCRISIPRSRDNRGGCRDRGEPGSTSVSCRLDCDAHAYFNFNIRPAIHTDLNAGVDTDFCRSNNSSGAQSHTHRQFQPPTPTATRAPATQDCYYGSSVSADQLTWNQAWFSPSYASRGGTVNIEYSVYNNSRPCLAHLGATLVDSGGGPHNDVESGGPTYTIPGGQSTVSRPFRLNGLATGSYTLIATVYSADNVEYFHCTGASPACVASDTSPHFSSLHSLFVN